MDGAAATDADTAARTTSRRAAQSSTGCAAPRVRNNPMLLGQDGNQTGSQTLRCDLGARREVVNQRIGVVDQFGGIDRLGCHSVVVGQSGRRTAIPSA